MTPVTALLLQILFSSEFLEVLSQPAPLMWPSALCPPDRAPPALRGRPPHQAVDLAARVLRVGREARRLKVVCGHLVEATAHAVDAGRGAVAVRHEHEGPLAGEGDEGLHLRGRVADVSRTCRRTRVAATRASAPVRSTRAPPCRTQRPQRGARPAAGPAPVYKDEMSRTPWSKALFGELDLYFKEKRAPNT